MPTEAEIEIHRALREAQGRYTYFLLAAAGAAIALAVNQTQGLSLSWSQIPLGLAITAWGLSFFCGCRRLGYVSSKNADSANRFGHWQFRLLIAGGVLYVAWHVWEMYLQA